MQVILLAGDFMETHQCTVVVMEPPGVYIKRFLAKENAGQ